MKNGRRRDQKPRRRTLLAYNFSYVRGNAVNRSIFKLGLKVVFLSV